MVLLRSEFRTFGAAAENAREPDLETLQYSARRFSEEGRGERRGTLM